MEEITGYKCKRCGTVWRYKPNRESNEKLINGQCDCGKFVNLENADLIDLE